MTTISCNPSLSISPTVRLEGRVPVARSILLANVPDETVEAVDVFRKIEILFDDPFKTTKSCSPSPSRSE